MAAFPGTVDAVTIIAADKDGSNRVSFAVAAPFTAPKLTDEGTLTREPGHAEFSWAANTSAVSYQYCLGTKAGQANVLPWATTGKPACKVDGLEPGITYFATARYKTSTGSYVTIGSSDGVQSAPRSADGADQSLVERPTIKGLAYPMLFVSGPERLGGGGTWSTSFTSASSGMFTIDYAFATQTGANCALTVDGALVARISDLSEPPAVAANPAGGAGEYRRTANLFLRSGTHTLTLTNSGTAICFREIGVSLEQVRYDAVLEATDLGSVSATSTLTKEFTTTADGRVCLRYCATPQSSSSTLLKVDGITAQVHEQRTTAVNTELAGATIEKFVWVDLKAGTHTATFASATRPPPARPPSRASASASMPRSRRSSSAPAPRRRSPPTPPGRRASRPAPRGWSPSASRGSPRPAPGPRSPSTARR